MKSDTKKTARKREKEKEVVALMIKLYCVKKHRTRGKLCAECQSLCDYACARSDRCPFMETKSFCANCRVHCYGKTEREAIRRVMRFSGPRMLFYHPVKAIYHVISTASEKRRLAKEKQAKSAKS